MACYRGFEKQVEAAPWGGRTMGLKDLLEGAKASKEGLKAFTEVF